MRGPSVTYVQLPPSADLLPLHQINPARYPHLLESVTAEGAGYRGRFDILFAFPEDVLELAGPGEMLRNRKRVAGGDFLRLLEQEWWAARTVSVDPSDTGSPFRGGWFFYLSYDFSSAIEPRLPFPHDPPRPLALAERFRSAVIRDRATGASYLMLENSALEGRAETVREDLAHATPAAVRTVVAADAIEEEPEGRFLDGVRRIQEYIRAGDVFQVNLSRRWRIAATGLPPDLLYAALRSANPAPFAGMARLPGGRTVISSSPERLAQVVHGEIFTRPIAGTFPRGPGGSDEAEAAALAAHLKERAEHIMLVDLERNDLGRVCRPGTVQVRELMAVETYRYVHHLVSEVAGRLRPRLGPAAVLAAIFPGGTITGCPKLRCMEIIRELEGMARGAYTGSMGYLNCDGDLDLNILIRTLVHTGTEIDLRAGAGIVADSVPERELQETRAKARGLLVAVGG